MKASLFLVGVLCLVASTLVVADPGHTPHNCLIGSLTMDDCALDQVFSQSVHYYTASVPNSVTSTSIYVNQFDPMAIVSIKINNGDYTQIAGFNLPNPVFNLPVGTTTVTIQVHCMDCTLETTIVITRGGGGVHGDPQFSGLKGQSYQIHGVAGEVYNIISDPRMQMNSRFVFLNKGECPVLAGKKQSNCFSHPGSYLGEIGVLTAAGDKMELVSGPAKSGYSSVKVNGRELALGEEVTLDGAFISRNSTHLVSVQASVFSLDLENSDMFINQVARVNDWQAVTHAHGLLGQTWSTKTYASKIKEIEGHVDDYMVQEKELFGSNYVYNRFD